MAKSPVRNVVGSIRRWVFLIFVGGGQKLTIAIRYTPSNAGQYSSVHARDLTGYTGCRLRAVGAPSQAPPIA